MTKNVLSIDLDYIMAPFLPVYNDHVGRVLNDFSKKKRENINSHTADAREFWNEMNRRYLLNDFISYDSKKLEEVQNLFLEKIKNISSENVYFGKEHDAILNFLCQDEKKKDEDFEVYNVDHHHDIFYDLEEKKQVENFYYTGIASWVWYLNANNKLKNYYWIKNKASAVPLNLKPEYTNFSKIYKYSNIDEIKDIHFDYIFVCKSECFLPHCYHYIYDDFIKQFEEIKNTKVTVDREAYCKDGKSRLPL